MLQYAVEYPFNGSTSHTVLEATDEQSAHKRWASTYPHIKTFTIRPLVTPNDKASLAAAEKKISPKVSREMAAQLKIGALTPVAPTEDFFAHLLAVKEQTRLRFSWTANIHQHISTRFSELGIILPADARGINSGARGGSPMYSLSSELRFPTPENRNILPSNVRIEGPETYISDVGLALFLAQQGFEITSYAKL
jgi:hypothetical protein